jgi:YD repeat-containing protein
VRKSLIKRYTKPLVEYDILGQVTRSTVPTEINANYEPAGDDVTRGWLWTSQEYDWKGRVTRTINTDGTDTLASYDGCGCAGGQITTIQGELVPRNDQPTVNARRTQKIYADILGRSYKTEVLNWDAVTPYTTTVHTFNGRDQVTNTRQYAGSVTSSTFQDVSETYDGHGRMKTRHYPVEDANTNTTWIYNNDDSVQQVIDPRNAITNFTYNNQGLTTQVSYSVPNNSTIPVAPTVNFTYDNLGNRTQMTDGTGTTAYAYNQLSQITAETKTFTGLSNSFTIGYGYHLGGGLKSVTDPSSVNSNIEYAYNKAGQLTTISNGATQIVQNRKV